MEKLGLSWQNLTHVLAVGGGSGLVPWMPGTWGTLGALLFYAILQFFLDLCFGYSSWGWFEQAAVDLVLVLATIIPGGHICRVASEAIFKETGKHDHGSIVWDEWAGLFTILLFLPSDLTSVGVGFLMFRAFDIWKCWIAKRIDEDKNMEVGKRIMYDDVAAALQGVLPCWLILWVVF